MNGFAARRGNLSAPMPFCTSVQGFAALAHPRYQLRYNPILFCNGQRPKYLAERPKALLPVSRTKYVTILYDILRRLSMQNERRNKSFPFSFVGTPRSPAKDAANVPSPAVTVLRNPSFIFPDYHSGVSLIFTGDRRKYHNGDRPIACRHHLGNDRICRDHQRDHRRTACKGGVPPRGRDRPAADAKTSPHRMTNRERGADTGAPLRSMERFMCGHIFP